MDLFCVNLLSAASNYIICISPTTSLSVEPWWLMHNSIPSFSSKLMEKVKRGRASAFKCFVAALRPQPSTVIDCGGGY